MIESSEPMTLATTVALPVVRGPVGSPRRSRPSTGCRAGVCASPSDRARRRATTRSSASTSRNDGSASTRSSARCGPVATEPRALRGPYYSTEGIELAAAPRAPAVPPLWVGSWGSAAGLRRRAASPTGGWRRRTTSPPLTSPRPGPRCWAARRARPRRRTFPNALGTMWFHITDDADEAEAVFRERSSRRCTDPRRSSASAFPWDRRMRSPRSSRRSATRVSRRSWCGR